MRHLYHISFFLLAVIVLAGCGGPSKDDIVDSVRQSLKRRVPQRLTGYMLVGRNGQVDDIKILFQDDSRGSGKREIYPVKLYVAGTCDMKLLGRIPFKGEIEYQLRKNESDTWQAESEEF